MELQSKSMEPQTSSIRSLEFGIYSPEEVLGISCCRITTSKNYGPNSVYDYKLGTIDEKNCDTCDQKAKDCPGHFGHIVLNEPILHPLYYRELVKFLRCVCTRCYKILISEDELRLHNIHIYKGQARFEKILDKLSKVDMCNDPDCGAPRPLVKHSPTDDSISLVRINGDKSKTIIPQTPSEIIRILNGLSDDDVRLLGFDPTLMHPRNLIFINLLVMPTCFAKDTIVRTDSGHKKIQDVVISDKLYTHTGEFREILEVFCKPHSSGPMLGIKTAFHPNVIQCTPEHPFYARVITEKRGFENGKRVREVFKEDPEWIDAKDLTDCHFIGMIRNTTQKDPEFNVLKRSTNCYTRITTRDQWFFLGYYMGDGWLDWKRKGRFYITFCLEAEEDIIGLLNRLSITHHFRVQDTDAKCKTVECYDYVFWHILADFGHLARNKVVPNWVHDGPIVGVEAFLDGYCFADGHEHKRNQRQFVTVSKDLAFSVQALYLKLGRVAGITYRKGGGKPSQIGDRIIQPPKERYDLSIVTNRTRENGLFEIEDDYIWFKVTTITNFVSDENDVVYNFEVAIDNSYCVENLCVHNCCRPWVEKDKTTYDDDFSIQYMEIVKANDKLLDPKLKEIDRQKVINNIKFKISSTFNNKGGRATHNQNGRPIKSIKNRITGKDGQIRDNLSGKRVEQSGRTVIGPDPTLKLGELAMPREMAEILTVPERVTKFNYNTLQEMVDVPRVEGLYKGEYRVDSLMTPDGKTTINLKRYRRGKMLYPGDIILRDGQEILVETGREVLVEGDALTRNGEDVPNLKYSNRPYKLKMGWIVERKLQDGDMVLLNRQPTLHSGSMQAMKIIVRPYKTLRINLAITKGFNADFDKTADFKRC
jgi:hypothetical protein